MSTLDMDEVQNSLLPAAVATAAAEIAAARAVSAAVAAARLPASITTLNATAGPLPIGAITGASRVTLISSNATPGIQTCRSAQAMVAEGAIVTPHAYTLRIVNTGAGTFTLGPDDFGTVTLGDGTYTVAHNTYRDFVVSFSDGATCVITDIGTGAWS